MYFCTKEIYNIIMNTKNFCGILMPLLLCLLSSCTGKVRQTTGNTERTVELEYAQLLKMRTGDGYTTVEILNPWDSAAILHRYVLVPKDSRPPRNLPEGDVVSIPLQRAAVYSSVHCGLADELGAFAAVRGVCDLQFINLPKVHRGVEQGSITDLGSSMAPNIERIINLQPDAILLSPFENSGSYGKLGKLHIPIIECADYMEATPLGRAEWMKLFGLLLGREREADSLFAAISKRYNGMRRTPGEHPTVVTEMKTGSTWYVAGGRSYVSALIRDAGGNYLFKDVASTGSVPQSPEKVFDMAQKADVWLIKYGQPKDMTLKELGEAWPANIHIKAYRDGEVYGCNLAASLFYEATPFHPDILLEEYISILHPEIHAKKDRKYYHKLK